ncbi:hypothetical protein CMO91_04070 [Candidatus Woesearchaeota archaeon]|nr:hypothetical protein [Candidatus Woesearchaeota archaeon]
MVYSLKKLKSMSRFELDRVWKGISHHRTPVGRLRGYVLSHPSIVGTVFNGVIESFWGGRMFLPGKKCKNLIAGQAFLQARTHEGKSLFDDLPCLVVDYSRHPLGRWFRNEIRMIGNGVYLCRAYIFNRFLWHEALVR